MRIESCWYECSPYCYAGVGAFAILRGTGALLLTGSGLVLLSAALTIVGLRWIHRRDLARGSFDVDPKRYVALITQDLFYDALPNARPMRSMRSPRRH